LTFWSVIYQARTLINLNLLRGELKTYRPFVNTDSLFLIKYQRPSQV
jgi:hypothetical protein